MSAGAGTTDPTYIVVQGPGSEYTVAEYTGDPTDHHYTTIATCAMRGDAFRLRALLEAALEAGR